jgi:hypothetical protein
LTAIGAADQTVTAQTTVQVVDQPGSPSDSPQSNPSQPDPSQLDPSQPGSPASLEPPATPQALSPGSGDRRSAPDLLSCPNSTPLTWQPGRGSSSTDFILTLQHLSDAQQDWLTVFEERSSSGTDVTPWLTQYQSYEWRWMVRSLDATGRSSHPSPWHYFTCYDFR